LEEPKGHMTEILDDGVMPLYSKTCFSGMW
jgi:hypothetical protein